MPSGVTMSQNILATAFVRGLQGRMVKVVGSGRAYMSLSSERTKPSIAEPSKPMPRVSALSSSSTVTETPFRPPSMSVNQRRMNLTSLSLASCRTKSIASESLWIMLAQGKARGPAPTEAQALSGLRVLG